MEYKSLKIDSADYDQKVFNKIKIVFDKMDVLVYEKKISSAIAYGQIALDRLGEEPDIDIIYPMISDVIAKITLGSMREVK